MPELARGLRWGSEGHRVRCLRALGEHAERERAAAMAAEHLDAPSTAVRRAAAGALARNPVVRHVPALYAGFDAERTEETRLLLAVALVRAGEPSDELWRALDRFDGRAMLTVDGMRRPSASAGVPPLAERFDQSAGDPPWATLHARRTTVLERAGSDARDELVDLAALRVPSDAKLLLARLTSMGRRAEHALLVGMGLNGAPEFAPNLRDRLRATDVDPGRGFAHRRLAAISLGRLGLVAATRWLLRALSDEAHDHEGRPGAGLGIQYPVRADILWALGEIADPAAVPVLVGYLGDVQGSALGGFRLPAMEALRKVGPPAIPALQRAAAGPEVVAAHAVAVLRALNADTARWRTDPRSSVARAAG